MAVGFIPCESVIGAEVEGVSLHQPPSQATIEGIEDGLERYGVLIFRNQEITPEEQVAWCRALGPLALTQRVNARLPHLPEIFIVGNTIDPPVTFSPKTEQDDLEWHADHMHLEVTARASMLAAKITPSHGGDTLFACMYSAYDHLRPEQQAEFDNLRVVHSVSGLRAYLQGQGHEATAKQPYDRPDIAVERPLVRHHPRSGRKSLYFGSQVTVGVVGWQDDKARRFIRDLTAHACQPAFQYRHQWRVGDAVLWDNRRVLHAGTVYDMERETRLMHRTTFQETEPV
jgi:alpha-ketoglutarate-dependent taurine dioxygenase